MITRQKFGGRPFILDRTGIAGRRNAHRKVFSLLPAGEGTGMRATCRGMDTYEYKRGRWPLLHIQKSISGHMKSVTSDWPANSRNVAAPAYSIPSMKSDGFMPKRSTVI